MQNQNESKQPVVIADEGERYEKMLAEVEGIITQLSAQNIPLDDMVKQVEKGYELISLMKKRLDSTKEKIEKLTLTNSTAESD